MNTKLAVVPRQVGVKDDVDARMEAAMRGLGRCAIQDCRRIAVCGEYCYECADQIEQLRRWQARKDAKRQARKRHGVNLEAVAALFFTAGRFTAAWGPR